MKKIFLMALLCMTQIVHTSPHCWTYTGQRALRKEALSPIPECPCNCAQQYQTTDFDKRGRTCSNCGHKLVFYKNDFKPTTPNINFNKKDKLRFQRII